MMLLASKNKLEIIIRALFYLLKIMAEYVLDFGCVLQEKIREESSRRQVKRPEANLDSINIRSEWILGLKRETEECEIILGDSFISWLRYLGTFHSLDFHFNLRMV